MKRLPLLVSILVSHRTLPRTHALRRFMPGWLVSALALGLIPRTPAPAADLFVQVDPPGWTNMNAIPYVIAWGDYDGDGSLDAVVPITSTGEPALRRPRPNLFYRNNGDGSFTLKGPGEVGPIASDETPSNVGLWGDVDNDGQLDLLVLNLSFPDANQIVVNRLYLNQGNGFLTSAQAGPLTEPYRIRGVGNWCDYDNDGFLDVLLSAPRPTGDVSQQHQHLLHGRGDGSFDAVTEGPIASDQPRPGDTLWSDLDGDGNVDLVVPQFEGHNLIYRNDGHGQFTRLTNSLLERPQYRFWVPLTGDLDNDGDLDLIAFTFAPEALTVFLNDGHGAFVPGGTVPNFAMPFLGDYDNDGDLDLLFSDELLASPLPRMRLNRNDGTGRFELVDDALTRTAWSGGPWVDDNNDGFLDLHAFRLSGDKVDNVVFRNQGNGNHWLKLRLVGTASNRSAIGAKVRVKATFGGKTVWQMRELISHYLAEDGLRAHFGLAEATKAEEVRIEWPSGNVQTLGDVAVDQILTVTEPTYFQPVQPVATINGSVQITNTVVATARQWFFEGAPLEAQTGSVLALTAIQDSQSGRYSVVAQTTAGPQTNHVYLRVLTQFTKILEGDVVTDSYGSLSATWFDDDNDGSLDLFVANSTFETPLRVADNLYHNQGDGTFAKVLDSAFAAFPAVSGGGAPGDFDNDGDPDLFTNQDGKDGDQLFRNDGKGNFSLVTGQPFSAPGAAGVGFGWADYDLDGDIDLFSARGYGLANPTDDALYRNNGDGTFTAVAADEAGDLLRDHVSNWGMLWFDYNQDGAQDLLVLYNHVGGRLHRNNRDGTFSLLPDETFSTMPGDSAAAAADYDNDGLLDLVVTPITVGQSGLYRNLGNGSFADVTAAAGIQAPPRSAWPFGTWADFDNDGFIDLFFGSYTTNCLYRNRGDGTFQSVNVGNLHEDGFRAGMGAWGDYDNNGFQDLYLVCGDAMPSPNHLYRNNGNGNHWLKVKVIGTTSNRDGMGAKVRVKATIGGNSVSQLREISGNAGLSGGSLLAHFGLGSATNATTVRVEWPSGIVQELKNVAADQFLTVTEPALVKLTSARVADGVRFEWRGAPNTAYLLQSSMNLTAWSTAQSVSTDATGWAAATLPLDAQARFFRVVKD